MLNALICQSVKLVRYVKYGDSRNRCIQEEIPRSCSVVLTPSKLLTLAGLKKEKRFK